jgi:3-(3-hydroxy-phenyl)propionate hydroxylase
VKGPGLVRLDAVLAGQAAVLTAREPDQPLADLCERYGLALLRIRPGCVPDSCVPDNSPVPVREAAEGDIVDPAPWTDVWLPARDPAGPVRALLADPGLSVLIRPDRVIAAVAAGCRPLAVPWPIRPRDRLRHPGTPSATSQDPAISPAAEPWSPPCS